MHWGFQLLRLRIRMHPGCGMRSAWGELPPLFALEGSVLNALLLVERCLEDEEGLKPKYIEVATTAIREVGLS